MGSECSRTLENSWCTQLCCTLSKATILVDVLFHHGTVILPVDAGLKWQHLCQGMWMDKEQTMPRRQCLFTLGPWEVVFSGWRNCFLCFRSMHTVEWHVGQGGIIIWKWFYVWELLKTHLFTLGGGTESSFPSAQAEFSRWRIPCFLMALEGAVYFLALGHMPDCHREKEAMPSWYAGDEPGHWIQIDIFLLCDLGQVT